MLRHELGIEPMLETRNLYLQIRNEDMRFVPPMGGAQAETQEAKKTPEAVDRKSSRSGLAGAVSDLKAAQKTVAKAIRELEDLGGEKPESSESSVESPPTRPTQT